MSREQPEAGARLGLEPEDLDGYTLDELADYLSRGRHPVDPAIERSAGCQLALASLERLNAAVPQWFAEEVEAEPEPDETWVQTVLSGIALDARAGRRIPFDVADAGADLAITEGALRGVVRGAESSIPGVLIGRCRFDGDVDVAGAPVRVVCEVSLQYGRPVLPAVERLRAEIASRIAMHSDVNVTGIDITVNALHGAPGEGGGR